MTKISKHISYGEATKSNTATRYGIDNVPNSRELEKMKYLAEKVFEPLREHFNVPIAITSFFRSTTLNRKIGGSSTSQHCKGEAMDIDGDVYDGVTNKEIFDYIRKCLPFDQMIWEFGDNNNPSWVHVSLKEVKDGSRNRGQILQAYKENGRTKYKIYGS